MAVFSDDRVVPLRKSGNEVMDMCRPRGGDKILVRGFRPGRSQVLRNSGVQQVCGLGQITDSVRERGETQITDIRTVDGHPPRGGVVQAGHKPAECRLPGTRRSDDTDMAAGGR